MRYKIIIEYDGTYFSGWQRQTSLNTVQGVIENSIYKFTGKKITVFCAGRTDTGVHAMAQVAHFDVDELHMSCYGIMSAINFHVRPHLVSVLSVERVADDWHARFMALNKTYVYKVINRNAPLALEKGHALHIRKSLDIKAMNQSSVKFIGTHDFSSFRSTGCQAKSPIRSLTTCLIRANGECIEIEFQAKSFLHNQVRIMVGCLLTIGLGEDCDIEKIIAARDRALAPQTAPACGLYLAKIEY